MAFACPRCGITSHNPMDEREGYCAACHDWTGGEPRVAGLYDRDGQPIPMSVFAVKVGDLVYRHVAVTAIGDDVEVSTVWLGMDYNFTDEGPPRIFETMVFGGELDGCGQRWPNEAAALAGHDQWVARVRELAFKA